MYLRMYYSMYDFVQLLSRITYPRCSWRIWRLQLGQIVRTVKYADEIVPLAKEETVLQGMIDKVIKIGRCCGMEMNVEKT